MTITCCEIKTFSNSTDLMQHIDSTNSYSSGSVSSCDAFLNVFQSHGLKPEVICPCATSPEAMTVAIRRYSTNSYSPFFLICKFCNELKCTTHIFDVVLEIRRMDGMNGIVDQPPSSPV